MARIDSILGIVVQQRATELRLGTDRLPKMLAHGEQKRLAIPETPEDTLRHLLGPLLSPEREELLRKNGRVDFVYDTPDLGAFQVALTARGEAAGFDVVFLKSSVAVRPIERSTEIAAMVVEKPAESHSPQAASAGAAEGPREAETEIGQALVQLLAHAAALRASDVHVVEGQVPSVRIDGRLRCLEGVGPIDVEALLRACITPHVRERLQQGHSADLAVSIAAIGRFRLNIYATALGLAAAIRLLQRDAPPLASLRLPIPLDDLVDLPHGLVIVCGPTGSGKSTTLAALAQEALTRRGAMLISLEDPIEYVFREAPGSLVRQRQVGRHVKDFATGLRDALREDPDIILIGEMRDPESITLALTAAETGHLVLTSLHSRSAASAVERIVDAYPAERQQQIRVQLADALQAVVAQRLLPVAHGSGRIPAVEVLRGGHNVASLIREGKTAQISSAIQSGRKEGMLPLERCLADLVRSGQIALEDARAVANEPASLTSYLKG